MRNNYLLSLFILLALLPVLIFRDYTPSNELRYLSIVDEALRSGHFLTFTNQGLPYADKPPLYFWLLIFSCWLLGGHYMWFLGLFSLAPALVVMGVMDRWVRGEVSADNRFTGRLMLMTCGLFLGLAIILRMDMLMCMFIVLSLYTFYRMQRGEGNHRRNAILFPVYVFLAVFSKGPVGILVPLLVSVAFLLVTGRIRTLGRYWGWTTWAVLLVGCALWFAGVYLEGGPEYLNNLLFHQTVDRAVNSFHHDEPFYYYFISVWYSLAPWSLLLIGIIVVSIRRGWIHTELERFFLTTLVVIVLMLSCISSKIAVYLTPAFPFFVYLAVLLLARFRWNGWLALALAVPATVFVASTPVLVWLGGQPATQFLAQPSFYVAAGVLTLTGLLALFYLYRQKNFHRSIHTIAIGLFIAVFAGGWGLPALNSRMGFADLCHKAMKVAEEKQLSGYITYGISRPESMDVFLHQDVKSVTILGLLSNDYAGNVLLLSTRAVKRSSTVRALIEGKEKYNVGDYMVVAL